MTNTEKFLMKEKGAKEAVEMLLALFDGKSYKFANSALNAAKMFLNEESQFQATSALQKLEMLLSKSAKNAPQSANTPVKPVKKK